MFNCQLSTLVYPTVSRVIIGVPPRTRTLTDGFGDCHAAITLEIHKLVACQGNDPRSLDYQSSALPLS